MVGFHHGLAVDEFWSTFASSSTSYSSHSFVDGG